MFYVTAPASVMLKKKNTHGIKRHVAFIVVLCIFIKMAGVIIDGIEQDAFIWQQPLYYCTNCKCSNPDASENTGA